MASYTNGDVNNGVGNGSAAADQTTGLKDAQPATVYHHQHHHIHHDHEHNYDIHGEVKDAPLGQRFKQRLHEVATFDSPSQIQTKHQQLVAWVGRIGWVGKGVVYAILGGLCCQSAVTANGIDERSGASASPQGAFLLVGSNSVGIPLLIVLAGLLSLYILWRFWEGVTGQGYDATLSNASNCFKFRLSPMISGGVYCGYLAYLIDTVVRIASSGDAAKSSDFTASWSGSALGKFGLVMVGIAFAIGFLVQLDWALRPKWHGDYRLDLPTWARWLCFGCGHAGFIGRGSVFLALSIEFFKALGGPVTQLNGENVTTVGNALNQLTASTGLQAVLFIMGFLLIVYGGFACSSSYCRIFPTPPPSRKPKQRKGEAQTMYDIHGNVLGAPHVIGPMDATPDEVPVGKDVEMGVPAKSGKGKMWGWLPGAKK